MKRTPLRRIKPLRQRRREGADVEREQRPSWAEVLSTSTVKPLSRGVMAGGTSGVAVNKAEPYRDRALLDMARGRPCLLLIPGICSHRLDTVVAAHSNLARHGKGGARKADDVFTVAACHACHSWLDQGPAPAAQKEAAFLAGHELQVMAWRNIAAASDEPERFRQAARRALERLNNKEEA